eukprot:m.380753 g.380753  ORF g.380753 m.380753 type:complete len:66 (+) comp108846_c0_seq1:314-511(+)
MDWYAKAAEQGHEDAYYEVQRRLCPCINTANSCQDGKRCRFFHPTKPRKEWPRCSKGRIFRHDVL